MKRDPSTKKVLIALNTAWNLVNFRSGLISSLVSAGYEVVAVAPPDKYAARLSALGCRYVPLPMDNQGTHPGRDLQLLVRFWRLLRRERPSVFLGFTVKPNIYGSLASHATGTPAINNIAGLGVVFARRGWLNRLLRILYRLALSRSAKVFFQNEDDRAQFIEGGLVRREIADRLPGSGVDLSRFSITHLPQGRDVHFLLVGRMLWDKGVGEYVAAARLIRAQIHNAVFQLLGFLDVQNPTAIPRDQMDAWVSEGIVQYLGVSDDVRAQLARADCVVLPSYYREGVPRTLLEAAAMGRPIVTTDSPGCRDAVEDGVTGFLCKPHDATDLAEKMLRVVALTPAQRSEMGRRARAKMEKEFDERFVIQKYLDTIQAILAPNG